MGDIARLFDFEALDGQPIEGADVDAEFDQLVATINALTDANIDSAAAIALSKLAIVPMVRVTRDASQSVADTTVTVVAFNTERYDTGVAAGFAAMHDTASNNSRLIAPVAGVYSIFGHVQWTMGDGAENIHIAFRVNGTTVIASSTPLTANPGATHRSALSTEMSLAANDYVEMYAFQNSTPGTTPASVTANAQYSPEFGMSFQSRVS
jgi:hypothetical protein